MYTLPVPVDHGKSDHIIVLLHGLGNNHHSWDYVYKALKTKNARVIIPDLLGFGDAPKPKLKYTPKDHADAVIATLDKLQVTSVVLAGHSMGCIVAIEVAKQRPDLVQRLVLLGAPLYKKLPASHWWTKLRRLQNAYFALFSFLKNNSTLTITAAKSANVLLPLLKGMEITEDTWPAFKASLNNTVMQTKSYADVAALKLPTLLVYGKLDVFVIKRNLRRLARVNRRYVAYKTMMGPHEILPVHGDDIAKLLVC